MRRSSAWACGAALTLAIVGMNTDEAHARVEAGTLTCEVGKGFALIISKPRDLHCVFHKSNGQTEAYAGKLREVGLDVGVSGRGVIAWGVIAATTNLAPGELAGTYGGVEAGAAAVIGGRGRLLVGGRRGTVSLQPLSVQGEVGLNIAVGVASMSLHPLFKTHASSSARVPAVGHSQDAVPHAQQIPHYGCGSYTHLQRGQTLSGLAHACGVTLTALLDANPQITNVRDIDAGTLVHLPTHVGHHATSPCGDRAILQDNEALDHLAWRCGVTLHALLAENPSVRDMAMVQPGLVLAIPEKSAPQSGPPVHYAMAGADILPSQGFVVSDAQPATIPIPHMSPLDDRASGGQMSTRARARLEIICVNEATNRFGFTPGDVFATNSVYSSGQTISVTLDAGSQEGVCLIDESGRVLFVTDLSGARGRPAAPVVAGAAVAGTLAATTAGRSPSPSAAPSRPVAGARYVPEEDFFEVSLNNPFSYLNMHSGPSAGASTVGRLPDGAVLRNAGGCQYPGGRQWCDVEPSGGGVRGWVAGEFLTIPGPGSGSAMARAPSSAPASSPTQSGSGERTEEVVRFASGVSSATVRGSVSGYDSANYVLGASAGQVMSVLFSPDNNSCYFNILPPSGGTAIFNGSISGNEFADTLPASGNYTVQAYLMRNAARRNETCRFSITFEISGGGAQASRPAAPATSDVSDTAQRACLAAVVNQTQERNVAVLSSEFSEANSLVMVGVGAQRAPWRCLVSNDGVVQEVMFTGDDSAGVPSPQAVAPSQTQSGSVTESACLSAVANETNEGNVTVLSSEFSEANSLVMVGVGDQRAPWRCLVSNDGVVQEVMFTGDDSAGVDQSAAPAENTATADDGGGAMAGSQSPSDVSEAAVQSCLSAVSSETGEGNVSVLSSEFSEANSLVMVGVGDSRAPWRCLVSNDGAVQEVMFTGDEGKL